MSQTPKQELIRRVESLLDELFKDGLLIEDPLGKKTGGITKWNLMLKDATRIDAVIIDNSFDPAESRKQIKAIAETIEYIPDLSVTQPEHKMLVKGHIDIADEPPATQEEKDTIAYGAPFIPSHPVNETGKE